MKIHLYQILVSLVALAMIYQGLSRYFKKQAGQTFIKLLVRLLVWGGMIVIVIFPKISYSLADKIGIVGNVNAVILTGFILVFLMIFKLLNAIERLEQQLTEVTRKEATKKINNNDTR